MYDKKDIDSTRSNIVKKLYDPMTLERKIFSAWDILSKEPAEESPVQAQSVEGFASVKDICKFTCLTRVTLWRLCKNGTIPYKNIGKRKLFKLSEVAKAIDVGTEK